jgi:lysyl-tRNA synthetase class 2
MTGMIPAVGDARISAHGGARTEDGFVARERERRLAKLDALASQGITPYPVRYDRDTAVGELRGRFAGLEPGAETDTSARLAGRVLLIRRHGGLVFADLHDQTGTIQLLASRDDLGAGAHARFAQLDRGDWIGVEGSVMATRRGELSLRVRDFALLSKALRALPDKHRGLTDVDTRLRERYLDLIANPDTRRVFDVRSAVIASVRATLVGRGFTEVETQVLDAAAGGAAARPFITHHNALDIDMYLRIALELPLKRLVVGGFERVFEIGRVFRNEGLDTRHNPEFTLLEAYQALADYRDMMELVETICSEAALAATGTTKITLDGQQLELAPPWRRTTMAQLIEERTGESMHPAMALADARAICDRLHVPYESSWGAGRLMSEVYDETGEATLVAPTFVYDYPREVSPLARTHRDDPTLTERFEAVVGGRELANAYSELNDPVDQRARFEAEAAAKAAGDEEAESIDEDYIRALEYGLPPTGGLGIGLDRLVMLIAGAEAIRDVILFPAMRPEERVGERASHAGLSSERVPSAATLAAQAHEAASAGRAAPGEAGPGEAAPGEAAPGEAGRAGHAAPAARASAPLARAATVALPRPGTVRLLAWLTALAGVFSLLPLLPVLRDSLGLVDDDLLSSSGRAAAHVATVLIGLLLILVAPQLARRKRRAWVVALVLFAAGAALHVLKGPDPLAVLAAVAMLVALVWFRAAFFARGDPASLLSVLRFVPTYLAAVLAFGVVSLLIEQDKVSPGLTVGGVLRTVFGGLVGLNGPYTYSGPFFDDFFPAALLALGIAGLAITCVLVFRSVTQRNAPSVADRDRARELVRRYGSDTLAPFALRSDKSYFFASDGEAMIAYSFVAGYALVAADPVGAPASVPLVLDEFLGFCRARAWHVAFLAVREADLPLYRRYGFTSVYLGDEAIIRCDSFTLEGAAMKQARAAVKRVGRDHHFRLVRATDASPALRAQLNEMRERWRGKAPERGFTMELGGGVKGEDPDFLLALALDHDERPVGFLRLVPCYGDDPGYSLDLMQREPDAPNGVTEFLIANAALALGERGFRRLSMNFAAWGRLFDSSASLSFPQRALKAVAEALNPFFQIKSLRDFNEKFAPAWLPRSIVIEDPSAMARVGLLYASVEGFLTLPVVGRYLVPPLRSDAG